MQVCFPLPRIRAPTELFRPFSKSKFKERFSEIDNMQKYYSNFFAFSLSCDWHFVSFLLFDFPEDIIGVVKLVFLRLSLRFFPCSLLQVTITDFITFFPSSFLVHFHLSGVEFFDEDERVEHIKLNLNINFHVSLLIERKNVYNIACLIKDLKWRGKLFRRACGLYEASEWCESEEAHLGHSSYLDGSNSYRITIAILERQMPFSIIFYSNQVITIFRATITTEHVTKPLRNKAN